MNRSLFILALIGVLVGAEGRAEVQVVFAPSPDVAKALEQSIESARKSIDLAIYMFNDKALQSRMKKAVAGGVKIRVILNKDSSFDRLARSLEADGIDVRFVRPVMHHKFAILDGPQTKDDDAAEATLLTGSSNWARVSYARYDEDLLRITEAPDLTQAYQAEFNLLWEHSIDYGRTIHGPSVEVGPVNANVWFTSANLTPYRYRDEPSFRSDRRLDEGVCGKRIIQSIDRAQKSIQIAATHFRRADLAEALKRAVRRGVAVELLLDGQELHARQSKSDNVRCDEELAQAGAGVRYKFSAPYWDFRSALQMHCKYMIVDAREVLTGSLNWSENSELNSMENLIAITSPAAVDAFVDRFQLKWNYGEGRFDALLAEIRKSKGRGPCSFAPISLTAEQIAELRKSYAPGACAARD